MSFQVSTVVWKCAPNSIVGNSEIKQLKSEAILFGEETPIVSESEIIQGIRLLAETEGIFTETAGGVVIASLIKLSRQNKLPSDEKTVCLITGNGLKTPDVVSKIKTFDIDSKSSNLDEILSKV